MNYKSLLLPAVLIPAVLAFHAFVPSTPEAAVAPAVLDPVKLAADVEIRRDAYGVPHILGKTEESAAFGFGYAQAEDHALEIARRFIGGRGENARIFGTSVESDFLIKRFDNVAAAKAGFAQLSPGFRRIVAAYVAGVNHYIAKKRAELPSWIPVFEPWDVLANSRAGNLRSLTDQGTVRALQRKYEAQPQQTAFGAGESELWESESGSNAFALAPSRTLNGKAILLGNPHLNWSSLYWEAHVTVPGVMDFFGSTLVGIPVLRAGFNEHLGWVTTNNRPDLADIYALKLDPKKADHYVFEGQSLLLTNREVEVEVRQAEGSIKPERRVYQESHLGAIIHRNATHAFAVRSTMLDAWRYFEGFYRLSRTRNLREWLSVMRMNLVPTSNFTYADAAGNILYQWNGRVPRRVEDGTSYELDVPAETGRYVWKRLHALEDFPRLLNPRGGYIQNCNNPPQFTSLIDVLDPRRYPAYFERGELSLRPQMALEMLAGAQKFSLEDVLRMKYNTKMLLADRVKPDLVRAIGAQPQMSEDLRKGLEIIEAWDNRASADSRGAVLFQRFWDQYRSAVQEPFARPWNANDPARTPAGLYDGAKAVTHFEQAVRWTRQTYGSEAVAWGEVHRYRFRDVDLPADGAVGTYGMFRVMGFSARPDGKRAAGWVSDAEPLVGFGDGWVLAVEFSRPVTAWSILAYGQTTDSTSPHSRDQIGLFAAHSYKRVWFREAEIRANLERSYKP